MIVRLDISPMQKLRGRSTIVSGCVLVCLVAQTLLPGLMNCVPTSLFHESAESAGCCVVNLTGISDGCCCGTNKSEGCGCACGKQPTTEQSQIGGKRSSRSGRTIESEICGCGGKHRPGFVSSTEPAVIHMVDWPLKWASESDLPEARTFLLRMSVAPPVPPPELIS